VQLHQLRYVLAVADHGSFSKAAEELFLSQPSLSVQVRKLERELGVQLFDRLSRRVVVTGAGEAFLEHVKPALAHLDQAQMCALDEHQLRTGRVAVGALPSVAARMLPSILADFQVQYPGVDVRLIEHNHPAEFERMVADGELDIAVVRMPRTRADLAVRLLVREPIVALLSAHHSAADAESLACKDLAGERFVAMESGSGLRELFDLTCQRAGFSPDVAVETTQLATLWGMVESGVGVALVPRLASTGASAPAGMRVLPLSDQEVHRELVAVWRDNTALPAATAALLTRLTGRSRTFSDPPDG